MIGPEFDPRTDSAGNVSLESLFPGREAVRIDIDAIAARGGVFTARSNRYMTPNVPPSSRRSLHFAGPVGPVRHAARSDRPLHRPYWRTHVGASNPDFGD
ncbi:hypothetical protein [Nocardia farcinica]|uniref:hypothetical protein n=1 Tax=Nocardia farcinica TaxID=37329 RepID=UPI002B4B3687|nr:hypothetical protein [Nocardia farcinica]